MIKKLFTAGLLCVASLTALADSETFQWSNCTNPMEISAFGTSKTEFYDVAATFDNPNYAGMKIVKIDAYINADANTLKNISNTSVFMATELTANPVRIKAITPQVTTLQGEELSVMSYELEEPYEITSKPLYIGYSLNVDRATGQGERYPVLVDKNVYKEGTCWVRTPSLTDGQWDINGYTYGAAVIFVTIAREVTDNSLTVSLPTITYGEAGKNIDVLVTVANSGKSTVNSITYEYSLDGGANTTNTISLENPIAPSVDEKYQILLPLNAVAEPGAYNLTLSITQVNGVANEAAEGATSTAELDIFPYIPQHRPLVEEYTALSCGYCPRGFAAMEYLAEEYPDDAVLICYHLEFSGNKDPMTVTGAAPVATTNYPTASIDRQSVIDPYYGYYENQVYRDLGIVEDLFERAATISIADIKVQEATVSMPDSVITVKTDVTFMKGVDNDAYRIGYVLSCDGLYDPTWKQVNYYSKDSSIKNTPLLDQFYSLPSSVYGLTFNDVAINTQAMRGIANSLTSVTANTTITHEYSFDVKDVRNLYKESLNKYLQIQNMKVNAYVIDRANGMIVNACQYPVSNVFSLVESLEAEAQPVSTVYYDLTGRRVANPDKGIFIMSQTFENGKVKTVKVAR